MITIDGNKTVETGFKIHGSGIPQTILYLTSINYLKPELGRFKSKVHFEVMVCSQWYSEVVFRSNGL